MSAAQGPAFLVVGASGLLGGAVLGTLKKLGRPAVGTQVSMRRPGLARFDLKTDRIADCVDLTAFAGSGEAYAVICASICQIDRCRRERDVTRVVNVDHTLRLIDDLARAGLTPVFISSSYVFDGAQGYYDEAHPRAPICEYGRHKAAVEERLERLPGSLTLRLDKLVGDDPAQEHVLTEWHRWISVGRPVTCIADQLLSPTSVADAARAVVTACERGLSGTYHVANPEFFSREELARQFALASGRPALIEAKPLSSFPFDDPRPLKTYLDGSRFAAATDFRFTSMRQVFRDFLARAARPAEAA